MEFEMDPGQDEPFELSPAANDGIVGRARLVLVQLAERGTDARE